MVDVRMPDGIVVRFPDNMPRDQIRDMIATKFPQVAQQQQAQAAPMPIPRPAWMQRSDAAPVPQPRPGQGNSNLRVFTVQAPDGRKIDIRAADEATAVRGAKEWVAANPAGASPRQGQPNAQGAGQQITININGQRVKVGPEFLQMSPEMQDQTVDEIAGQMGMLPNGTRNNPPNFGAGGDTNVQIPNGDTVRFPAGMSQADIETVLQQEYPPTGVGGTNPLQVRLDQIGAALQKADAAGNTPDATALANAYRQLQGQISDHLAGNTGQQGGGKLQDLRRQYPQYADMPDQQLADALYRKFYSDMSRAQFDSQMGLAPAQGPSPQWLQQNPSLADLPIPGTIRPSAPPSPQGSQPRTGAFENATAGLNDALYRVAGAPVDLANTALRIGAAGANVLTGSDIQLPVDTVGGHQSIADAFGKVGVNDPANVVPADNFERSLRAGGEGAGYAVAPELVFAQLSKLGIVGAKAQQLMGQIFGEAKTVGSTTGNMVAGATSGMGAQIAADAAPDDWKGTAALGGGLTGAGVGALVTQLPRLAGAGGRAIGDFLAPFSQGGREQMAGQQLRKGSTSPGAVIDAIANAPSELVPGSRSTTFQMTGDMGIGGMERGAAANNPGEFMQRRADQNAARIGAIEGMQPTGAPETIAAAVRSHMKQIDDQLEAAVTSATRTAQGKVAAIGQGTGPDIAGGNIRNSLETARSAAKAQERALWDAVDPDGTLALSTTGTKAQTARIIKEMPTSAKPPEGEEAAIMGAVRKFGETMPFSEITALQSRIKTALRAERLANGESPAYRRLSQLNSAIQNDLENAIVGKVTQEQQAVQAGQMRYEDSAEYRLAQERDRWAAARSEGEARLDGSTGLGAYGGSRPPALPRPYGTEGQIPGGPRNPSGNPRLSPNDIQPNFDRAALDRLTAARQATKGRAETFDNGTLGPIRRRPGTTSPYDMPVSAVPAQIFNPSPKSVDSLRSYRAAVGDGPALQSAMAPRSVSCRITPLTVCGRSPFGMTAPSMRVGSRHGAGRMQTSYGPSPSSTPASPMLPGHPKRWRRSWPAVRRRRPKHSVGCWAGSWG